MIDASALVRLVVDGLTLVSLACIGSFGLGQVKFFWANPQN